MGQVFSFSSCIKLCFGLDNRKLNGLDDLLISPPKLDSCNDSHSEPSTESSTACIINIDSSSQILNEEFKSFPDLDNGGEDKSCVINIDSSIQAVDNDYKSFLDLDKEETLEGCLLCEDKTISHANSYTGSSTHFVTNKDSIIPVVEKEYKSSPVLKTGEVKAGLIFGEDESNANEQNLLISSLTFFTDKDSIIPVVEKEYKSSPVLKTGEAKAGPIFGEDESKANEQNLLISSLTFVTNKDSSIPFVEKEYESSPVLKTGEAKAGLIFGEDENKANEQNLLISSLTFGSCNDSHKKPRRRKVKICKENMGVVKERCIKQYCSSHKILLVGEGDFSFSASLALAFGSASNMIATSLDSEGLLRKNYMRAMSNIQELKNRGCLVMHGVDVTQMADYYSLQGMRFDRIIYNFPLVGFSKDESKKSQLKRNRKLVRLFFMNAKKMISEKGEIHIAHKSRGFFLEWNLKSLAGTVGLRLIKELPFNYNDFEGYCTKYGLRSSTESSSQVEVPEFDTGSTGIKEVKVYKEVVMMVKEKWIKQYCSSHKILLVGEGDFSFSACLALAFGSASNMIATSLDSEGFLRKNYMRAMPNIQELKNRGCLVMHGVDATETADYYFLRGMRFDRIIYNFPLAGFFKDESRKSQLKQNRKLVRLFFINAKKMICEKGEIHIAHKSRGFFLEGTSKSLAGTVGLRLIEELPFNYKDFAGYCTKYGLRSSSQVEVPEFDTGGTEEEVINEVKVCKEVVVVKEKWIKQYCSSHKILLVGDGDFSFSASLAVAFGSASNMIATSLDSEGFLRENYKRAMPNIQDLKNRGCFVMHGIDATEMADHYFLRGMRFDRIIYNFPLAGFFKDESRKSQLKWNRKLVRLFFMNAKKMISENGEIHIAHKSWGFFLDWNLKSLAGTVGLRLINELSFNVKDFSGYCTKYGFGGDNNFNNNHSKRYIFGL